MNLELHVWRQAAPDAEGSFFTYHAKDVSPDMSFLEMLDVVNEGLVASGGEPIAFDHDCREGICGSCGMMINGGASRTVKSSGSNRGARERSRS
jgi:succinate dehydrogenase / fumarate reductase iron-sulfur subunit